jgi:Mn-dependent DtxR family transcriptional regulator
MPVKVGQRFVLRGSLAQAVLSYVVSEPGEWTARGIAEDIEIQIRVVTENVRSLQRRGLIVREDTGIQPTKVGREALLRSMGR